MTLWGLAWAAFAPLALFVAVGLIALALRGVAGRWWSLVIAALIVLAPVASIWSADRAEFRRTCTDMGPPVIRRTASAEGVYLASGSVNSFGMRYLHQEGFRWIEAADYRYPGAFVRYARGADGSITTDSIGAITAQYMVEEIFSQPHPHTGLSMTRVVDRVTGEELARAGSGSFSGGRAKWVLGAWGSSSCPNAANNIEGFDTYYHLAQRTLR